jgi:Na+/H+ antiporter NhaC
MNTGKSEQNQIKKSFFRRFWWIFPVILVSAVVVIVSLINQNVQNQKAREKEKQAQLTNDAANQNQTYQYVA